MTISSRKRGCYVHFEHPVSLDKYSAWGCYVLVWERQANGSWAWAADTWNDMSVRSA